MLHGLGKLYSYEYCKQMHFHMMQSMCRVNSICFDSLSSDHILLHKTWDYRAWIDNYNSGKCILIWCKPCRVCELNKCELSFNQELSYWDNKQHCIRWLMHYNNRVYVYINKIICNKNKIKTYFGIKSKNKVLPLVEYSLLENENDK